jgi:hypothetical protein
MSRPVAGDLVAAARNTSNAELELSAREASLNSDTTSSNCFHASARAMSADWRDAIGSSRRCCSTFMI